MIEREIKPVASLPTQPGTPVHPQPPVCVCSGAVVVNQGDTLVLTIARGTAEQAQRHFERVRDFLPDTVRVLVGQADAVAVVRGTPEA